MKLTSTQLRRIIREEVKKAKRLNEGGMFKVQVEDGLAGLEETIINIEAFLSGPESPSDVFDEDGFLVSIDNSIAFLQELKDNYRQMKP